MSKNVRNVILIAASVVTIIFAVAFFVVAPMRKLSDNTEYEVWYVRRDTSSGFFGSEGVLYQYTENSEYDRALYHTLAKRLISPPNDSELFSVFPEDTVVRTISLVGSTLNINFSSEFNQISPYELTLAKYCIAKTFSEFESISEVSISVEGAPLKVGNGATIQLEDFVTGHSELYPQSTEIQFYTLSPSGDMLISTIQTLTWYPHDSLPALVCDMLFENDGGGAIPSETKVVSLHQTDSTVYIELSPELSQYNNEKGELAIYSIVNTISSIPDISYVVVSLGGELSTLGDIPLDTPLLPDLTYVYN